MSFGKTLYGTFICLTVLEASSFELPPYLNKNKKKFNQTAIYWELACPETGLGNGLKVPLSITLLRFPVNQMDKYGDEKMYKILDGLVL